MFPAVSASTFNDVDELNAPIVISNVIDTIPIVGANVYLNLPDPIVDETALDVDRVVSLNSSPLFIIILLLARGYTMNEEAVP